MTGKSAKLPAYLLKPDLSEKKAVCCIKQGQFYINKNVDYKQEWRDITLGFKLLPDGYLWERLLRIALTGGGSKAFQQVFFVI